MFQSIKHNIIGKRDSSVSSSKPFLIAEGQFIKTTNLNQLPIQAKLKVNQPNDPYEQEADRIADQVVSMSSEASVRENGTQNIQRKVLANEISSISGRTTQRKCSQCEEEEEEMIQRKENDSMSQTVSPQFQSQLNATTGGGQTMDKSTQQDMSGKFGIDFSRVRIHRDSKAATLSQSINAKAFTLGNDIYFNHGQYQPNTKNGQRLLAHELVHTVQQGKNKAVIQRTEDEAGTDICEGLQQRIDHDNEELQEARRRGHFRFPPHDYDSTRTKLNFCRAIQEGRTADIPNLFEEYLEENYMPTRVFNRQLLFLLAAKLRQLDLSDISEQLLSHFDQSETYRQSGTTRRKSEFYRYLAEFAINEAQSASIEEKISSLEFLIDSFIPIRNDYAAIDRERLQQTDRNAMVLRPHMTLWQFHDSLHATIISLFTGIEQTIQSIMDAAITELQNNGQSPLLDQLKNVLQTVLHPALFPSNQDQNIAGIDIQITNSTLSRAGNGVIHDSYRTNSNDRSRDLPITTYDPSQEFIRELRMPISQTYHRRIRQIRALGQIYGQTSVLERERPFSTEFSRVGDAERNAQAIQNMNGPLRLHNNDDWRQFVLQKYFEMVNPPTSGIRRLRVSPSEAINSIIQTLEIYMQAFTIHARYSNVYDIGTNYLNRNFPRSLSGQLIQDCGVYALRVAYILSLVGRELGLRFRFVRMPAHVALVIYGDNLPAIIVHNNHFSELSATEWETTQESWRNETSVDENGQPTSPTNEDQFVGEVASAHFIEGPSDTPFRIEDLTNVPENNTRAQNALWRFYQRRVNPDVFGSASNNRNSPQFNFQQRYLNILERRRQVWNQHLVGFWNNEAPGIWQEFEEGVRRNTDANIIQEGTLHNLLQSHQTMLLERSENLRNAYQSIETEQREISRILRETPNLAANNALVTNGERTNTLWVYFWQSYFNRVANQVTQTPAGSILGINPQPILDNLAPPFIPIDENRVSPID